MATPTTQDTPEAQWRHWHRQREAELAASHGWLTLTSFQWLDPDLAPLEELPGLWQSDGVTATVTAVAADRLHLVDDRAGPDDGAGRGNRSSVGSVLDGSSTVELAEGESRSWVSYGSVVVELALRAGRYAVRTRDSAARALADFDGVPAFDYAPAWVIRGRFEPYAAPHDEEIASAHEQIRLRARIVGDVVFMVDGVEHRLGAEAGDDGALTVTFYDRTNGATTASWRFVRTAAPAPDGSLDIDFNRALNYPMVFSAYGACPAPVRANALELAVEAGEKMPR